MEIFIVEDEPSIYFFYKELLSFYGFQITGIAKNGEEAVSMFKSLPKKPQIVLMDHRMPIKNGIEATKEILNIDSNTKVIFTSADKGIKEEALSMGAFCFKEKPFNIENLITKIKEAFKN